MQLTLAGGGAGGAAAGAPAAQSRNNYIDEARQKNGPGNQIRDAAPSAVSAGTVAPPATRSTPTDAGEGQKEATEDASPGVAWWVNGSILWKRGRHFSGPHDLLPWAYKWASRLLESPPQKQYVPGSVQRT